MALVLIGYRGSGKSSIGCAVAGRLSATFIDLDELIVRQAGQDIRDIFARDGEECFRDLETKALRQALQISDAVIALGGGAVVREETRRLLKDAGGKVIYLRCQPEELLRRIEADPRTVLTRPNLTALGGGIEEIRLLLAQRQPLYRLAMDAELDVTKLAIDQAVMEIVKML